MRFAFPSGSAYPPPRNGYFLRLTPAFHKVLSHGRHDPTSTWSKALRSFLAFVTDTFFSPAGSTYPPFFRLYYSPLPRLQSLLPSANSPFLGISLFPAWNSHLFFYPLGLIFWPITTNVRDVHTDTHLVFSVCLGDRFRLLPFRFTRPPPLDNLNCLTLSLLMATLVGSLHVSSAPLEDSPPFNPPSS